jgi:ornithine cyclodeaminase/alanine dehydrogenase-like protein (mu-crystallin family)
MEVLVATEADVHTLLPMRECIDVMEEALRALARGEAMLPLRQIQALPGEAGLLALMPSYLGNIDAAGVKVITVFPRNEGTEFDSHQGAVLLFEGDHGRLLAIADATSITAIRTAAVSGVATRALAREDAEDLAILGSGTQAGTHLEAMLLVRPIRRVRVWSRTPANARRFAERESLRSGLAVEVAESAREAVEDAALICTATSAREPILRGEWLAPGTHLNAVGFGGPAARELDTQAVVGSRLFVDRRESALSEAGDFVIPKTEGVIGDDHIVGELGDLLLGRIEGRTDSEVVTLFESLGIAIEDLAAVHHVYVQASARGVGTRIDLGGARDSG